jgi:superfamily I DNA/RNA helicase
MFLIDECQDTTEVMLEIFKLVNAKKKIMLGDTHQNIYSYMNTVNGFEVLHDTIKLKLTKSFRCTPGIAQEIERFGKKYFGSDFQFKGNENRTKMPDNPTKGYLSRSNGGLIENIIDKNNNKETYYLIRGIKEIFSLPVALHKINNNEHVNDIKFKYLKVLYKEYLNSDNLFSDYLTFLNEKMSKNIHLCSCINILLNIYSKKINIYDIIQETKFMSTNPNITLATAHTYKGQEADIIYLHNDLNAALGKALNTLYKMDILKDCFEITKLEATKEVIEMFNIYYVAMSRAKYELHNVRF